MTRRRAAAANAKLSSRPGMRYALLRVSGLRSWRKCTACRPTQMAQTWLQRRMRRCMRACAGASRRTADGGRELVRASESRRHPPSGRGSPGDCTSLTPAHGGRRRAETCDAEPQRMHMCFASTIRSLLAALEAPRLTRAACRPARPCRPAPPAWAEEWHSAGARVVITGFLPSAVCCLQAKDHLTVVRKHVPRRVTRSVMCETAAATRHPKRRRGPCSVTVTRRRLTP